MRWPPMNERSLKPEKMSEVIALTHTNVAPPSEMRGMLRRLAILFDRIDVVPSLDERTLTVAIRSDIEALRAAGVLANEFSGPLDAFDKETRIRHISALGDMNEQYARYPIWLAHRGLLGDDTNVRWRAALFRSAGRPVYPIVSPYAFRGRIPGKIRALLVVLETLPVPSSNTPWKDILEFRADPAVRGWFFGLKDWMNEVAKAKLSAAEMADRLAWLVHQHEEHMKLHRLKADVGGLEAVVVTAAEVVDELAHLHFGKAAKLLFTIRHRRIELLEAELGAPGREVAYVVKARGRFRD